MFKVLLRYFLTSGYERNCTSINKVRQIGLNLFLTGTLYLLRLNKNKNKVMGGIKNKISGEGAAGKIPLKRL